jgi:hypothetical protein
MQLPARLSILSTKSHFCLISFLPSPEVAFAAFTLIAIQLYALNFEFLFLGPSSLLKTSGITSLAHLLSPQASQSAVSHHQVNHQSTLIFH